VTDDSLLVTGKITEGLLPWRGSLVFRVVLKESLLKTASGSGIVDAEKNNIGGN
jgi:hypothetical protein